MCHLETVEREVKLTSEVRGKIYQPQEEKYLSSTKAGINEYRLKQRKIMYCSLFK